ncbi:MAG: YcjX family protein [Hyphomicrobium sp.]
MADLTTYDVFKDAQARLGDYLTPAVRLGVTGLSRAGKTVFITALVRNLVTGGRLPFFVPDADGRIVRAFLEPQPDDSIPRFNYEAHFDELTGDPPQWPDSTRRISELRVTIEYRSENPWKRALGLSKLHLDIVDYPGEWLVDLPLLNQSYEDFSREALVLAADPMRTAAAKPWLDFLAGTDPGAGENEQIALFGTKLYVDYLKALRASGAQATLAPGRFLLPGDLEGSPLLTFFPMPLMAGAPPQRGSLAAMMARRFESYKAEVAQPFFTEHFARLNRQIVLVDVLGALDQGSGAVGELERAMGSVLSVFRPGANSWWSMIAGKKIDKILFAATKADHLHAAHHDRLGAILKRIVDRALVHAEGQGAGVSAMAIAAVRATREAEVKTKGETLPCLKGVPLAGERIGDVVFDGVKEAAIFPGDLPPTPDEALDRARSGKPGSLSLVRFRPPKLPPKQPGVRDAALPHIRLDRALDFLISDYLT